MGGSIAERKAAAEYEETLAPYIPNPSGPPTPVPSPPEVADEPVAGVAKAGIEHIKTQRR